MRLLPERRRYWRIVTLKNAVWVLAALIVLFVVVSAWNELRPENPDRERLYQRGTGSPPPATRPLPANVDEDPPVADQTSTIRGRSNHLEPVAAEPAPVRAAIPAPPRRTTLKEARQRGERIVITEGAEGVRVQTTPATATTQTTVPPERF
jgi:hypothetical protein